MPLALTLHDAQRLHLDGRLEEAETAYRALSAGIPSPELPYLYGTLLLERGDAPAAAELLTQAAALRPEWPEAHANLGTALFHQQRIAEARACYEAAIRLNPREAHFHASIAATFVHQGTPHEALSRCRTALSLDPMCAQAHWNAALAHLELGEWEAGWREYDWGFATGERVQRAYHESGITPEWTGKPGQSVVLHGEQGLGEEILFASCVPDALRLCRSVTLECHPRLARLFARSFPETHVHGTRKDEYIAWPCGKVIDAKLAVGSLPRLFRNADSDFPRHTGYLRADTTRVEHYRRTLGPGPRIGIAWAGGTPETYRDLRSIPLDGWGPVLAASNRTHMVSLQYGAGAAEEAARQGLMHVQDAVDDLDEQAALIKSCDLIISVCQTVVHLAGALGVPVWCLTPATPAWRYRTAGDRMAWYPAVTLIRQTQPRNWAPVLEETARRLGEWLAADAHSNGEVR